MLGHATKHQACVYGAFIYNIKLNNDIKIYMCKYFLAGFLLIKKFISSRLKQAFSRLSPTVGNGFVS